MPTRDLFAEAADRERRRIMRRALAGALAVAGVVTGFFVIAWGPNLRKGLQ